MERGTTAAACRLFPWRFSVGHMNALKILYSTVLTLKSELIKIFSTKEEQDIFADGTQCSVRAAGRQKHQDVCSQDT